jgi:hypothetical protein
MKKYITIIMLIIASILCYASTLTEREDLLKARLEALTARKAVFKTQSEYVIHNVGEPMIAECNALIIESQAVQDEFTQLVLDYNTPEYQAQVIEKLVQNACDPNSLVDKANALSLLKVIIDIAREELTK